jgi:hypothetical protein
MSDRWLNLITAFTNVTCVFPLYQSIIQRDWITTCTIGFVAVASFVSHLVENHKHGMVGFFEVGKQTSWILNRFDVVGSIGTISRLLYLYYQKYGTNLTPVKLNPMKWILMLMPLVFLRISEYDKYNEALRMRYVVTHSIWHLSVFGSMNYFLENFIYV